MRILFVHGRAQEGKDPVALKRVWIETLRKGMTAAGLQLPSDVSFDFPFYGDKLDEFTNAANLPQTADVIAKGAGQDRKYEDFMKSVLGEMYEHSELKESDIEAEMEDAEVREKGFQNWNWVQAIARAIDKNYTKTSKYAIQNFLRDVYLYVNSPGVTQGINHIVEELLTDEPTVVIGHSLGSVVAYRVIMDNLSNMNLCKYVTVGSPLGIKAISSKLGIPDNPANKGWYNAYDERDIVALNPLNDKYFPTDPEIVNNSQIDNFTDNRHGIIGYLNNPEIAKAIVNGCS